MKRIIFLLALLLGFSEGNWAQNLNVTSSGCGNYCFSLQGQNPNIAMGDTVTVDVMWGDGQSQSFLASTFTTTYQLNNVCHSYQGNGSYRAVFYVHHQGTLIDSVDTVLNVSCFYQGSNVSVNVSSNACDTYCFNLQGTDSTLTTSDSVSVFFDWGDGQTSTNPATSLNGGFSLSSACHTYSSDSTYSVTMVISVNGQPKDTLTKTLIVDCANTGTGNATLTVTSSSCNEFCVGVEGTNSNVAMGDTVTVNIFWGDGQSQTELANSYTTFYNMPAVCHTYANDGTYQLMLYIYHQGNLIDSVGRSVIVACNTTRLSSKIQTLKIYPNPVSEILILQSPTGNMDKAVLLNLQGQTLKTIPLQTSYYEWNLADLPQGIYLLQIYGKDFVKSFKIIKE